jgi:hypothetical protein
MTDYTKPHKYQDGGVVDIYRPFWKSPCTCGLPEDNPLHIGFDKSDEEKMTDTKLEEYKKDIVDVIYSVEYSGILPGRKLFERRLDMITDMAYNLGKAQAEVDENTSDGYHTFKELYQFRMLYNANLFNEWYRQDKYNVHKSYFHNDGQPCFGGGWFIVMANTPKGQISNHYENKHWNLFNCEVKERADKWDGHTPQDVLKTLQTLTTEQ